jgi:hypothetical protein
MSNLTLFAQIVSKLDRVKFSKLVSSKQTDKHQKGYSSLDPFGIDAVLPICQKPIGKRY